ncbi:445L [Invertebrate iridescent virus Kaz2018]|uniref:445L n=1 Tax=Invertebrate iridescent virus 6 TaxID=176652 RepID=Q91F81_IIV6|nr:445L [Invertebrate iridescent virus 6]AAK82305.1 445L [Invertebrate iridescent virus 6]QNH08855.1 445L [Invertebrate iridescent virus Kaz2018]
MAPVATVGAVATLPVKSPNISIPPIVVAVAGGTVSVAELTLNTVPEICSPEPNVRFVGVDAVLLEPII